jgi:uncharacterized protein YndB with AHSA1/START domain
MGSSDPVQTATFRMRTGATPDQVWAVLTCPRTAPSYLHGLTPRTCWRPGAPVQWQAPGLGAIPGQVLHADPPYRLSLTVEDGSGTCTYLTWSVRGGEDATVVRLDVEERDSCESELEDVWLPVLERLTEVLREPLGRGSSKA